MHSTLEITNLNNFQLSIHTEHKWNNITINNIRDFQCDNCAIYYSISFPYLQPNELYKSIIIHYL